MNKSISSYIQTGDSVIKDQNYREPSNKELFEETYPLIAQTFRSIMDKQYEMFASKMLSYGIKNITLGSNLETQEEKDLSLTSVWIRCMDKMNRLKNLVLLKQDNPIKEESMHDNFMDIVNYNIIAQIILDDKWKRGDGKH